MAYTPKTWEDGESGGTPITAAELNRMEQGIVDSQNEVAVTWATLSGKPATFTPTVGTTSTTAKAGNYVPAWGEVTGKPSTFPPAIGTTAATALAGNTALLALGSTATTAAAGNHTHAVANITGLQAALDAKATAAALAALEARVAALETPAG